MRKSLGSCRYMVRVTWIPTIMSSAYVDEFLGISANRDNILSTIIPGTEANRS